MFEKRPFNDVNTISVMPPTMSVHRTTRSYAVTSTAKLTTRDKFVKHVTVPDLTVLKARLLLSRHAHEKKPTSKL